MNIQLKKYVRITPGKIYVDGNLYFESADTDNTTFLNQLYNQLDIDYRKYFKMDILSKTGFLSAEILLENEPKQQPKEDMGILLFNRNSSLESDTHYQQTIQQQAAYYPSPSVFVYTLPNIVTGEIAIRNKIHGETAFYVFSQPEGQTFINIATEMIRSAGLKQLLLGWLEVYKDTMDAWMVLCEANSTQTGDALYPENIEKIYTHI